MTRVQTCALPILPAVPHFGDRDIDGKDGAVLALPLLLAVGLADDLPIAGAQVIPDVAVVLAAVRIRHEDGGILANDFVGRIAEDGLGGRIERLDDAFLVDGDRSEERRVGKECRSRWSP